MRFEIRLIDDEGETIFKIYIPAHKGIELRWVDLPIDAGTHWLHGFGFDPVTELKPREDNTEPPDDAQYLPGGYLAGSG